MTSRERFEAYMKSQGCEIDGYGLLIWEAAERDMLERVIAMGDSICAKSTSLGGEDMLIPDLVDKLKELLNEQ